MCDKNKIKEIVETLDILMGDTEPNIDEDWTDEEIRTEEPLFWSVRELYNLIERIK